MCRMCDGLGDKKDGSSEQAYPVLFGVADPQLPPLSSRNSRIGAGYGPIVKGAIGQVRSFKVKPSWSCQDRRN